MMGEKEFKQKSKKEVLSTDELEKITGGFYSGNLAKGIGEYILMYGIGIIDNPIDIIKPIPDLPTLKYGFMPVDVGKVVE